MRALGARACIHTQAAALHRVPARAPVLRPAAASRLPDDDRVRARTCSTATSWTVSPFSVEVILTLLARRRRWTLAPLYLHRRGNSRAQAMNSCLPPFTLERARRSSRSRARFVRRVFAPRAPPGAVLASTVRHARRRLFSRDRARRLGCALDGPRAADVGRLDVRDAVERPGGPFPQARRRRAASAFGANVTVRAAGGARAASRRAPES